MRKHLLLLLFAGMCALPDKVHAQLSPSGQTKVITPSILSACAADTIWVELTNKNGPTCVAGSATVADAQVAITIPGNGEITYQSGTVDGGGATEVSYIGNVLTMDIPVPSFGTTTRSWFVLNSTCAVTGVSLPSLSLSATYPPAFNTAPETWESSQMNTGQAQITYTRGTNNTLSRAFGQTTSAVDYVKNTGFGKITKLIYHQIVHDSLVPYLGGNPKDHIWVRRFSTTAGGVAPLAPFSLKYDQYPDAQMTNLGNGYREYSIALEGEFLDREDGEFNPGDRLQMYSGYFRFPTTCIDEMLQKKWFTYECVGSGATCNVGVDTLTRVYRVNAGIPIIGGLNSSIEPWDGCANKNGSFTFRNTGVPNAADSNVSVAFDVNLSLNLSGKLFIDNLTLGGSTVVVTAPSTPGDVKSITWNLKDQNTVDFDGPGGIQDLDGDGFFDDLAPGDSVQVVFTYTVDCDKHCGSDLYYNITAASTFTDFCRKLNGKSSTSLYEFGFKQTAPVSQVTPLPNYGTMSSGSIATQKADFTFNFQGINVTSPTAIAKLRINYSKNMTIKEPIVFLGTTIPLASFTQIGTGSLDTVGYNGATDVDSALEYTLTAAQVTALLDNVADDLSYYSSYIACDSFQNQNNTDSWQILYQLNTTPCPAPSNSPPCALDLTCNKAFAYRVVPSGCIPGKPCYVLNDSIYRTNLTGYTNEEETTSVTPSAAGTSKFYEGDTMSFLRTLQLTADYPVMEDIGAVSATRDFYSYFSFSYNKDPQVSLYDLLEAPYSFIPNVSRLRVIDTTTNTVLHDIPLGYDDFRNAGGFTSTQNRGPQVPIIYYTNATSVPSYQAAPDNNSVAGKGLGDYWCFLNSWTLDNSYCPYADLRARAPGTISNWLMHNDANDRVSEVYYLYFGRALSNAGISFAPGYSKYVFEIDTKWRVNPDYDHQSVAGFKERGGMIRIGNGTSPAPAGTYMSSCGGASGVAVATTVSAELAVSGGGATYQAACNLTVCNNIDFETAASDFFPNEVRVPFKMDSIIVDLPTEYSLTAAPTFGGSATGPTNSIVASANTGRIVFTNNMANSGTTYMDFPRMNDSDGGSTVWSVCYPISNVGTDNNIIQSYKVPVTYYARDEFGMPVTLVDTFNITEANPAITIAPLGGAVQINDGGACANSYMDVLVSNNTIYAASNVFLAAESNPNVTVVSVEDAPGETPVDPITSADTSTYGMNNLYTELGGMAAGGRRVVRVTFNTSSCADSLKIISNFGCNYPLTQQPEYDSIASNTIDSAFINFNSVTPGIMSGPIDGNKDIVDLCTVQTLEIELRNVKNPNLTNILAGVKLPANAVYVANSAEIAYPSNTYVAATGVTITGTDSITVDVSADLDLATSCGLNGADESTFNSGANLGNSSSANAVKVRFDIDFTACPTGSFDPVVYNVSADNYCGTTVTSSGVFNLIYVGTTVPNTFSCESANGSPLQVCADKGVANSVTDSMWVKNETGPSTTGIGSTMEIIIANDTALFDVANYAAAAPWSAPVITTNAEGRTVLNFTVPAAIAAGDSLLLVMTYDLTPKVDNVCTQGTTPCAELAHSITFYSETLVDCAAKSLSCSSLGQTVRGTSYVPKSIECCKQTLGDFVWLDENGDGVQDPTEPGVAGVTVTLYDSLGNVVGTTVTDAYGMYLFDIPVPGDYTVGFTPPPNYTFTSSTGTDDNDSTNSDVNTLTGQTGPINIARGEDERDVDAGIIPTTPPALSSIGDQVWYDTDGDGMQDSTEMGVSGVTVTLYDSAGNVVAVTTTDANGNYLFNDLPNGTYSVGFDPLPGTTLTSSTGTTPNASGNSDANPNTGTTGPIVISAPGTMITGIDAGLIDDPKSSLGDKVFNDLNQDGIQDPNEPGVPGVEMILWDAGPDGIAGTPDDVALDTAITNANGNYLFTGLDSGAYFVTATPPSGYSVSPSDQGTDDYADSDFSNVGGTQTSQVYNLLDNQDYPGADLGIFNSTPNLGSLGDKVFLDLDGDGIQDPNEQGLGGVTVSLLDGMGNPVLNPATGEPYVVQTDPDGNYLFTDLPAGTYSVAFSNLPPDYSFSPQGQGADSTMDSDVNPATGTTGPITLGPGEDKTDIDAGVQPFTGNGLGSIGDKVFVDANNDGLQDPLEQGVPNVTVYLYEDTDGDGIISGAEATTPVDSTVTDGQGNYQFTDLPAGNYQVGFDINTFPAGYTLQTGKDNQGSDDALDSDADPITGLSPIIPLGPGEDNSTVDAGIYNPTATNSIGNYIWLDTDMDGVQDPGEAPLPGVTVNLLDSLGNIVASVQTDENGMYLFDNLPNGTYSVQVVPLPGSSLSPNTGSDDATNSDFDPLTGLSNPISLTGNTNVTDIDGGIFTTQAALGDKVFVDTDKDGIQDPGEPGVPGVLVKLYRPGFGPDGIPGNGDDDDPVASAITDGDGNYYFPNLDPGTYEVEFSNLPSGYGFTDQDAGSDDAADSDADPVTGRTAGVILAAGDINTTVDAGLVPNTPGSVGDYVWFDADMDGIQDPDEVAIPGVKVELKDALGNVVATTFTDGSGAYRFDNVPPGDYSIQFTDPNGGAFTTSGAGNGSDDSDADATGSTGTFTVNAGEHTPNIDAGITSFTPLPVDGLTATKARIESRNSSKVYWHTLSELNTDRFVIERSIDAVNFQAVGELNAGGTTNAKVEYSFDDNIESVDANVLYYRIKLTDIDGKETISNIVSTPMISFDEVAVYPNLFENKFTVAMNVKRDAIIVAQLTDVTGRTVNSTTYQVEKGNNEFLVSNLESLATGTYYLKVINQATKLEYLIKVQKK